MIEIVRAGTYVNKGNKKYRVQCWKCNAIFRFDRQDSIYEPLEHDEYISCPQCGAMTGKDLWIENKKHRQRESE